MSPRVALITAAEFPELDEDGPALREALARCGVHGVPAVWTDPAVDWSSFELAVLRSAWDYSRQRPRFIEWIAQTETRTQLVNAPDVLRWNTDKRYLTELERRGIDIVPTRFVDPGDSVDAGTVREVGRERVVVKPVVSSGARNTARYGPEELEGAVEHIERLHAQGCSVMLQPYLSDVDSHGETALLFFDGVFSHAIRKGPLLRSDVAMVRGLYRQEQIAPRDPAREERRVAEQILDALPWPRDTLAYARVDLLRGPEGEPRLLELELSEPSLFLAHHPRAPTRFAEAIARRVSTPPEA